MKQGLSLLCQPLHHTRMEDPEGFEPSYRRLKVCRFPIMPRVQIGSGSRIRTYIALSSRDMLLIRQVFYR